MIEPPAISTLFPYTTLFRSGCRPDQGRQADGPARQTRPPAASHRLKRGDRLPTRRAYPRQKACDRTRSEEHTSELQSQFHLVCRLLLEKKKSRTSITWLSPG